MARAPRVFTWSDGLHVYTVATSSKVKALQAWGVTRDLFKDGEAEEISDGADADAARASPGEVIRRGLKVDVGAKPGKRAVKPPASKPPAPPKPSKADIARAHALEREIAGIERDREALDVEFAARRARLEREARDRRADLDRRRRDIDGELAGLRAKIEAR